MENPENENKDLLKLATFVHLSEAFDNCITYALNESSGENWHDDPTQDKNLYWCAGHNEVLSRDELEKIRSILGDMPFLFLPCDTRDCAFEKSFCPCRGPGFHNSDIGQ